MLLDDLPPLASEEFMPAVRALVEQRLAEAVQAVNDEYEAELLDRLLRGAPDAIRREVLGDS